jgi:hypothetical protein
MTQRSIVDPSGTTWSVSEIVVPVDMRHGGTPIPAVITGVQSRYEAWLLFESFKEIRRLRPYPENWQQAGDATLLELLAKASPSKG